MIRSGQVVLIDPHASANRTTLMAIRSGRFLCPLILKFKSIGFRCEFVVRRKEEKGMSAVYQKRHQRFFIRPDTTMGCNDSSRISRCGLSWVS